jgi:hypothetical protein
MDINWIYFIFQYFRESSVELRELESKLRQAYINKELHAQMVEKRRREHLREEKVSF